MAPSAAATIPPLAVPPLGRALFDVVLAGVVLAVLWRLFIRIVPGQRFVVVERWGRFRRVLGPGLHLMWPWIETLHRIVWSQPGPGNRLPRDPDMATVEVPTDERQVDVPPVEGMSADKIQVALDATLVYAVDLEEQRKANAPPPAVYRTPNLLLFIHQCMCQAVRHAISQHTVDQLYGHDLNVADQICAYVQKRLEGYGVRCSRVLVQRVVLDGGFVKERDTQLGEQRAAQARKRADRIDHERRMAALEAKKAEAAAEHDRALQEARTRVAVREAAGWTVDQDLEYQRIAVAGELARTAKGAKVIYMPATWLDRTPRITVGGGADGTC